MRRLGLSAVAAALGLLLAPVGGSLAAGQQDASAQCAKYGDFGLSHGACMSWFTSGDNSAIIAEMCQRQSLWDSLGVTNRGECIDALEPTQP